MIFFVVGDLTGRYPMTMFLAGWGKRLAPNVRLLDYDTLFRQKELRSGTYIFSDLDYLDARAIDSAEDCWEALREVGGAARHLNHPRDVLRRYDLLVRLHEMEVNDFTVHRLTDDPSGFRFPVFLRAENDHDGPRTGLLTDPNALADATGRAQTDGVDTRQWMVTEFREYRGDDGLYRKYGAFNVGGRIIPRHMIFSHDWMTKSTSRQLAGPTLEEERAYIAANPHEERLREIFAAARIDYGRVDYTVHDGNIRVFEINTNPQIVQPGPSSHAARTPIKARFTEQLVDALESCHDPSVLQTTVPLDVPCVSVRRSAVSMAERIISFTSAIGLERHEAQILRALYAMRAINRTGKQKLWNRTPGRVRNAFHKLRHGGTEL